MRARHRRKHDPDAGFTLIETLIATALFLIVVAALATITGQWLPSWDHGIVRVQRAEQLAFGIDRVVADLAAAQFISPSEKIKTPIFDGTELGVTFVRGAVGPNTRPGLEIVRIGEIASEGGPVLARATAPFVPLPDPNLISSLKFSAPTVLVRAPFRVQFAYAGADGGWQPTWRGAEKLPRAVRVTVRNAVSGVTLAASSAVTIHVDVAPECVTAQAKNCTTAPPAATAAATAATAAPTQNPGPPQ